MMTFASTVANLLGALALVLLLPVVILLVGAPLALLARLVMAILPG